MRGFGLAVIVACGLSACTHTEFDEEIRDVEIDAYFSALSGLSEFNGTVLAQRDGDVVHLAAYTIPGDLPPSMPVSFDSQYDIRSVSKLVAQVAVFQLEEDGLLSRTTTVAEVFSDFPRGDEITVQHLMDNQSGLPREFTNPPEDQLSLSADDILALATDEELEFEPGTDSRYSNVGYQVLYAMIAAVSGRSFVAYTEEEIFSPAGMAASGGHFGSTRAAPVHYAFGHFERDGELVALTEFEREDLQPAHLYSSAADLNRFLDFISAAPFSGALADEEVISHAGGSRGKRAYVETNTALGYSFVFLSNYDELPFSQVVSDMRAILEGEPYAIPERVFRTGVELPIPTLRRYEGTYSFAELEHLQLTIRFENGALSVYQDGKFNGVLTPENERTFFEDPESNESVVFRRRPDGRYDMLLDWQGVRWVGEPV